MNKASIEVDEAQKCLNVLDRSRDFSFQNDFDFVEIHLNVFNNDDEI